MAQYIKRKVIHTTAPAPTVNVSSLQQDSQETWLKRAQEALEHNNTDYAQDIFINRLKKSKEEFSSGKRVLKSPLLFQRQNPLN